MPARSMLPLLLTLFLPFAVAISLALAPACGAITPAVIASTAAAVAEIADRAITWIDRVERHVEPALSELDAAAAADVRAVTEAARVKAEIVRSCADRGDCDAAKRALEAALTTLFGRCGPLGVRQLADDAPPMLFGSRPDGTLGVASPRKIVHGDG